MADSDTSRSGQHTAADLTDMTVDQLRNLAREEDVHGRSTMRKDELVDAVRAASGGDGPDGDVGAGPDGGEVRTGPQTSTSITYSQNVTLPEEEAERPGRSLVTTHHEVIKQWAEERDGVPATVEGTEHGDHLGVLRLDFGGDNENLRQVSWEEWFGTFDARRLNFIYQEERSDGRPSNFFRLESPHREDA